MKVSIITAALNNVATIEQCIDSIYGQSYNNVEHIIIAGGSNDGTLEIIEKCRDKISGWESKPEKGIYHALNNGINMARGDIIGFLHADDYYANDKVVETVVSHITKHKVDSCYGDLLYVKKDNTDKVVRYWKSCAFEDGLLQKGWMPPHPAFFVKKKIYENYGCFNTSFKIAADYELMLRFLGKNKITTHYIPEVLIKMRIGGKSNRSVMNMFIKSYEDYNALKLNNMNGAIYTVFLKNLSKLPQFFHR